MCLKYRGEAPAGKEVKIEHKKHYQTFKERYIE